MKKRVLATLLVLLLVLALVPMTALAADTFTLTDEWNTITVHLNGTYVDQVTKTLYQPIMNELWPWGTMQIHRVAIGTVVTDKAWLCDVFDPDGVELYEDALMELGLEEHPEKYGYIGPVTIRDNYIYAFSATDGPMQSVYIQGYSETDSTEGSKKVPPTIVSQGQDPDMYGEAYQSNQSVTMNGQAKSLQAYALHDANGNPTNYMKLRDIADLLDGTKVQFDLGWDGAVNIITNHAYEHKNGQENQTPYSGNQTYYENTAATKVDGVEVKLKAFAIYDANNNASTYYKLRDIAQVLDFNVYWDGGIVVDTNSSFTGEKPE